MEENRLPQPDPASITDEVWKTAEEAAWQEVLLRIHPTLDAEEKRKDVIEYVQRLIKSSIGVEVFPYGSVPLKTYLPDGDIDLTAVNIPDSDDFLSRDVFAVMHAEQLNANAEYEVRDTQFIDAEVKLVKCIVQNIVIDISFNQLGGLSTLCFLEQVDRLVGKDHLFKRSIILIKAWCYYESRILGAHHGLISTYALESLILYIFHIFNSSLNGPLAVLYRFLDYFSKFDWENYCVSLNGPVLKSSLPHIVVDNPGNREDWMLSDEFLRNCVNMFSVSSRNLEGKNLRMFPKKHLNIIDPLKETNNLGRSVHKASFYRIRSAFKYGARKLGKILLLPREEISSRIKKFFESTLERHDREDTLQICGVELGRLSSLVFANDELHLNSINGNTDDDVLSVEHKISFRFRNELDRYLNKPASSQVAAVPSYSLEETSNWGDCFLGEFNDTVTFSPVRLQSTYEASDCSSPRRDCSDYFLTTGDAAFLGDSVLSNPEDNASDSLSFNIKEKALDGIVGDIENSNLSDLSGDYDSHIRSLLYGQCCHGYNLSLPSPCSSPSPSPSQFQKKPWDTVRQHMPLIRQMNTNGAAMGQPLYTANTMKPVTAGICFDLDEKRKARGTGTYIPNLYFNSFRERPLLGRRKHVQESRNQLQKHGLANVAANVSVPGTNSFGKGGHELMQAQAKIIDSEKPDLYREPLHVVSGNSHGNGISIPNGKLEFGSFGSWPEGINPLSLGNSGARESTSNLTELNAQNSMQVKGRKQSRIAEKSLNLKNEEDFPPLSS